MLVSKRLALIFALASLVGPMVAEATILTDNYIAPVVARGNGAGGTTWKTEICVSNPWDYPLNVRDAFVQGGQLLGDLYWQIPPYQTVCSSDAVGEWLGRSSWAGAYVIAAFPEDNPGRNTHFVSGVKIYNTDPRGTFGQALPIGSYVPEAWSVGRALPIGLMSGVQNYGTAGSSGFRTNVGLFNPAAHAQSVDFYLYDSDGRLKWSTSRSVPGMSQIQIAIPSSVNVRDGVGVGINNGNQFVFSYASIVDNRSGDGVYRPFSIAYENVKSSGPEGSGIEIGPRESILSILESVDTTEVADQPFNRQGGSRVVPDGN